MKPHLYVASESGLFGHYVYMCRELVSGCQSNSYIQQIHTQLPEDKTTVRCNSVDIYDVGILFINELKVQECMLLQRLPQ